MRFNYPIISQLLEEIELAFLHECLTVKVDFINVCSFPPGEGFSFHMHSGYEFHYIKKGKGTVILNGLEYLLEATSFYVTAPGVVHRQIADSGDPMVEYAMMCQIEINPSFAGAVSSHSIDEFEHIISILDKKTSKIVSDRFNIHLLFEKIFLDIQTKKPFYYSTIKNTVFQIIVDAARNFADEGNVRYTIPKRDIRHHRIDFIESYIIDNYCRNITCKEIADHLSLSTRQVTRIVRSEAGCSVHDFIISKKIESIKETLKSTQLRLGEIADQTGFYSGYHLSNAFKKWTGISPARYREMNKSSELSP